MKAIDTSLLICPRLFACCVPMPENSSKNWSSVMSGTPTLKWCDTKPSQKSAKLGGSGSGLLYMGWCAGANKKPRVNASKISSRKHCSFTRGSAVSMCWWQVLLLGETQRNAEQEIYNGLLNSLSLLLSTFYACLCFVEYQLLSFFPSILLSTLPFYLTYLFLSKLTCSLKEPQSWFHTFMLDWRCKLRLWGHFMDNYF